MSQMHPNIIEHDISRNGSAAFWYAFPSNPDFAIAWLLPDGDGRTYNITGRDGCFYSGFTLDEAIICAHIVANSQHFPLQMAA